MNAEISRSSGVLPSPVSGAAAMARAPAAIVFCGVRRPGTYRPSQATPTSASATGAPRASAASAGRPVAQNAANA